MIVNVRIPPTTASVPSNARSAIRSLYVSILESIHTWRPFSLTVTLSQSTKFCSIFRRSIRRIDTSSGMHHVVSIHPPRAAITMQLHPCLFQKPSSRLTPDKTKPHSLLPSPSSISISPKTLSPTSHIRLPRAASCRVTA